MRIGIFGGSFNPPHKMHKNIALNLIKNNYLEKVIYVPTGNKYNKKDLVDASHRYEMLKLMIQNYDFLEVSDYELKNNLTYTYQILNHFQEQYPNDEIYFICGSDNLKVFSTWKNYKYILNTFKLLVITRNNDNISEIMSKINNENVIITNITTDNVSSTEIRKNLLSGLDDDKIDKEVKEYIVKNNLYLKNRRKHERNN